jgi:hypothetical protein
MSVQLQIVGLLYRDKKWKHWAWRSVSECNVNRNFTFHLIHICTATYPAPWRPDAFINAHYNIFKKFFTFKRTEILTHCVFRILLEASKIATDLFVIKLSTCNIPVTF